MGFDDRKIVALWSQIKTSLKAGAPETFKTKKKTFCLEFASALLQLIRALLLLTRPNLAMALVLTERFTSKSQ